MMDREWAAIGRCIDSNHTVLNYEAVLKKGFAGLEQEVLGYIAQNGETPLYTSALRICRSAQPSGLHFPILMHSQFPQDPALLQVCVSESLL